MYKALIVSPPTIDLLHGGCRAGGPALYAGYTFKELGIKPYAIGPIGYSTSETVGIESRLGIYRVGYTVTGAGMVFELSYEGSSRSVRVKSSTPVIDVGIVLSTANNIGYHDIILVSPVYGEEHGGLPQLLQGRARITAVDVQGYYRAGLAYPDLPGSVQVVHASEDEFVTIPGTSIFLLTRGPGRVDVYMYGSIVAGYDPPPDILADPTGAGDSFTAAFLGHLIKGYSVEDSVALASELVPVILDDVHAMAWIGDCSI